MDASARSVLQEDAEVLGDSVPSFVDFLDFQDFTSGLFKFVVSQIQFPKVRSGKDLVFGEDFGNADFWGGECVGGESSSINEELSASAFISSIDGSFFRVGGIVLPRHFEFIITFRFILVVHE